MGLKVEFWANAEDVPEEHQANVALALEEAGLARVGGVGGAEEVATAEEVEGPFAAVGGGHQKLDDTFTTGIGKALCLLGLAYGLAVVRGGLGHGAAVVPAPEPAPPGTISVRFLADLESCSAIAACCA